MALAVAIGAALATLGVLLHARRHGGAASVSALLVAFAFAVVALWLPLTIERRSDAVPTRAALPSPLSEARTQALAAAALALPAADQLVLEWQAPLPSELSAGVLGAVAERPAVLPLQPEALQVRALSPPRRDRPVVLAFAAGPLAAPLSARVVVRHGDAIVAEPSITLGQTPVTWSFRPAQAGRHEIEVVVEVAGHSVQARGEFTVAEPPTVLVVEDGERLTSALRAQGVAAQSAAEPPADWRTHAAVVVGKALPSRAQNELFAAVLDGLGVLVAAPGFGGDGEPMRALLPIRPLPQTPDPAGTEAVPAPASDTPPKAEPPPADAPKPPPDEPPGDVRPDRVRDDPIEVDKHAIAMVLVIDRSASMKESVHGSAKMSYAKTAAMRTAETLGEGDTVAIVTFGRRDEAVKVLPLTPAIEQARIRASIAPIDAVDDQTYVVGALRLAREMLKASQAAVKHVVVVTDGEFMESNTVLWNEAGLLKRETKGSLSIIAITDERTDASATTNNEKMTRIGGGQFHTVRDATEVPAFVVAEVTRALQRAGRKPRGGEADAPTDPPPLANAPPPVPNPPPPQPAAEPPPPTPRQLSVRAVSESRLLEPRPLPNWPSLRGATAGESKFEAETLLVVGEAGWPLLAFANRGLGRAAAFAADLGGDEAAAFRADPAFPAWFAQWVQSVVPPEPAIEPLPLLARVRVTPPAPTPRDDAVLGAIAGQPPRSAGTSPASLPTWRLERQPAAAEVAGWLVAALVLCAAVERWARARRLQAGA